MKKIILFAIVFSAVLCTVILGTETATVPYPKVSKQSKNSRQDNYGAINADETPVRETADQTGKIKSYTLKYESESRGVILISNYADGSEIITRIKSINPRYLENKDIDALTEGIELTSKEEMHMLIEDYSS